jgi:hypothetical protein
VFISFEFDDFPAKNVPFTGGFGKSTARKSRSSTKQINLRCNYTSYIHQHHFHLTEHTFGISTIILRGYILTYSIIVLDTCSIHFQFTI